MKSLHIAVHLDSFVSLVRYRCTILLSMIATPVSLDVF